MNILILVADQLSAQALGCYAGGPNTPNLDLLASTGRRFTHCFTTCPLCQPARAAFWTGRFPHETGILSNGWLDPVPELEPTIPTLGEIFLQAGYDTVHFGKRHDAGSLRGFRLEPIECVSVDAENSLPVNEDTFQDRATAQQVCTFLASSHRRPFLAVADLNNPHNICQYVGNFAGSHAGPVIDKTHPLLPENFIVENFDTLPAPIRHICCSHNRQAQAAGWTPEDFRQYLAAYAHYTRRVDMEIGCILQALQSSAAVNDTMVVFFSDHGDAMAAHGLVTKQVSFYEEVMRVPLIFAGPGILPQISEIPGLASLQDLLPTLTDFAGLPTPDGIWGRSLRPALTGCMTSAPHDYVAAEWFTEWGITVEPGRMIRTERWKYTRYLENDGEELYDLQNDPGERRNLAGEARAKKSLLQMRALLRSHLSAWKDPFESLQPETSRRGPSHPPGYTNHHGPAAPARYSESINE